MTTEHRSRVESLDYLRGLMAMAVMLYHYAVIDGAMQTGVIGKVGIYAVAVFYVLSGVSLGMVYRDRLSGGREVAQFWTRRLFRIVPLFWLATLATLAIRPSSGDPWLNFTLLFSVLAPSGNIATGAWSIGNELVFYAILPLVLYWRSVRVTRWAFAVSVTVGAWYAFALLDPATGLAGQWATYAQPLNHLFLFLGGVAIVTLPRVRVPTLLGAASLTVFYLYPAVMQTDATTGLGRVVLSAAALGIVLAIYQANPSFAGVPARTLAFLGQGCYSIYLLHPIVRTAVSLVGAEGMTAFVASVVITLGVSYISFHRLERPLMDVGARVAHKLRSHPALATP